MEPPPRPANSSPYRIFEPSNNVEIIDIEAMKAENERLKVQLQKIQVDKLRREREELQRQIAQLEGSITIAGPSNTQSSNPTLTDTPTVRIQPQFLPAPDPNRPFSFDDYDLPPIYTYTTREKAMANLNQWALKRDYGLSNAPSKSKGNRSRKAIIGCDRREPKAVEGPIKIPGEGKNKRSNGTGCKWSVILREEKGVGWYLRYREL